MARGLSDLQQFILRRLEPAGRVYYASLLEGYFHWPPLRCDIGYREFKLAGKIADLYGTHPVAGQLTVLALSHFSPRQIGEARYNRGMANLSRACVRLEKRGLVKRFQGLSSRQTGVEMTSKGWQWLKAHPGSEPLPPQLLPGRKAVCTAKDDDGMLFPELGDG
jgi:hypothetical protein